MVPDGNRLVVRGEIEVFVEEGGEGMGEAGRGGGVGGDG